MSSFALSTDATDRLRLWGPTALFALAAVYVLATWGSYIRIVDDFNLIVHEAGHWFFGFFGDFVTALGGSLMQLILPAIFVWSALRYDSRLGTQVSLLWFGQSAVSVSVYAADAQERALPLIGGLGETAHDWWWILLKLGWLQHDDLVAAGFVALAVSAFVLMVLTPRWMPH